MSTAYCQLSTVYCILPTTYCQLPNAFCLMASVDVYCLLSSAYCLLFTDGLGVVGELHRTHVDATVVAIDKETEMRAG